MMAIGLSGGHSS